MVDGTAAAGLTLPHNSEANTIYKRRDAVSPTVLTAVQEQRARVCLWVKDHAELSHGAGVLSMRHGALEGGMAVEPGGKARVCTFWSILSHRYCLGRSPYALAVEVGDVWGRVSQKGRAMRPQGAYRVRRLTAHAKAGGGRAFEGGVALSVVLVLVGLVFALMMAACGEEEKADGGQQAQGKQVAIFAYTREPITEWDPAVEFARGIITLQNVYECLLKYDLQRRSSHRYWPPSMREVTTALPGPSRSAKG